MPFLWIILWVFGFIWFYKNEKDFFTETKEVVNIKCKHLIGAFLIFLSNLVFNPFFSKKFSSLSIEHPFIFATFISNLIVAILLLALCAPLLKFFEKKYIFKDIIKSFFLCCFLFPSITLFAFLLNHLILFIFKIKTIPDQIAVKNLKEFQELSFAFWLYFATIVILAPIIEEILFRGMLQNFLKKYFGGKGGILISSLCFAFFHYSYHQKISNITIIGSLFILSVFLGFFYEKRKTMLSVISLHSFFNIFSIFHLFLLKN